MKNDEVEPGSDQLILLTHGVEDSKLRWLDFVTNLDIQNLCTSMQLWFVRLKDKNHQKPIPSLEDKVVPIASAREQREALHSYGYRGASQQEVRTTWQNNEERDILI